MVEIIDMFQKGTIRIRSKLIFILILTGLLPFLIIGIVSLNVSKSALLNEVFLQLEGIRDTRKAQVLRYLDKSFADITVLANSSHINTALDAFSSTLTDDGLDNNLFNYYESLEYGDSFNKFIEEYGYYDIMLITLKGDIVYSLRKEGDLSQNVTTGPLSNSLLGKYFNKGLESVVITDFQLYSISGNQPIAFLLAPIRYFDNTEGVLVLKLSTGVINDIMLERSGMGETSEVYIVGSDKLMRSDSFLDSKYHSVQASMINPGLGSINTFASNEALNGKTGKNITKNYKGTNVLAAYIPINFHNLNYALIAEINESEALGNVYKLRNIYIVIAMLVVVLIIIFSVFIANRFTEPITALTEVSIQISAGQLDHEIKVKSNDELGILAHSFEIMRDSIKNQILDLDLEIEQRKNAEEELLKHRDNLEIIVENRTSELKKAMEVAEEADRAKSDFLANMSHEIRTPMNAIIGLDHLLAKTKMTKKQQDYVEKIGNSAKNLLGIINDILDFSKIEAGKLEIEETDFKLNEVLNNLSGMIGDKAMDKGIELIFRQDMNTPVYLVGDPLRLGQILLNLTNNAIKFTEHGEVVVTSKLVKTVGEKVLIRFDVSDTGIGLKEDQLKKLFNSFSQADSTITRKYGGTGLGLSISKKLCEMMGGSIGVDSTYGKGSTFYFTVELGVSSKELKNIHNTPLDLKGLKVLVVDDNQTSREVLCSYLDDFSFEAKAVSSGELALRELIQSKATTGKDYDLVLMDYLMDDLNGIETSKRINNELENVNIPQIIMVTGVGREEIINQGVEIGIKGFINKPVSPSMLFDTIMETFGKSCKLTNRKRTSNTMKPGGFEDIRGANLLLVEDNPINQQVAKETLESEGFYVEIAENGKVGLDMLGNDKSFDLVLMDLQMPIMDGYEATVLIRKEYDFNELPIVAMTADAMTGVRDNVIKSGMNDYVTKPINPADLWKTLVKWIKPQKRKLPQNYTLQNDSKYSELKVPEIPGINISNGLSRVGGNKKLYLKLLSQLRDDYESTVRDIHSCLENEDNKTAVRLAHTLKSVAGNIGAKSLQIKAEEVQLILEKNQDSSTVISSMDTELQDIIREIKKANISSSEGLKESIDIKLLSEKIDDLKAALEKRKAKIAKDIIEELDRYSLPDEKVDVYNRVSENISKYKFKDALFAIESLIKE